MGGGGGGSGGGGGGGGGGGTGGWGGWWASSVAEDPDLSPVKSNAVAPQETQSVPEPSSLIALIALGGIGFLSRKK